MIFSPLSRELHLDELEMHGPTRYDVANRHGRKYDIQLVGVLVASFVLAICEIGRAHV